MIVTRSWLNEWIDLEGITTDDLCKTFNSIGLEVERLQTYDIPSKIIFGRILECKKHPDADKLNLCKVDIGTSVRQIVCGASNVREGLTVVVATIGAKMPGALVIKPVKLRGIESEGMICSATEIGLPDFMDGIIEIDESVQNTKLGSDVNEHPLFKDDLIEIELTANRGDCLSIRGIARDLSAAYNRPLKNTIINTSEDKRIGIGRILNLSHDESHGINLRYKAINIDKLILPFVIKLRLAQIDESKKSAILSLMLYVTHSSGVILRAYEHDFFKNENDQVAKIELREDKHGFACVMSINNKKASTVGIIQEDESFVNFEDGIVLVEASYIPPDIISKKMQESKIKAGSLYYKTSRGSEPELNRGLDYFMKLVEMNSSSSIYGGVIELCDNYEEVIISITKDEIDNIIGADIDKTVVTKLLQNLGFNTSKSQGDTYVISVPRYRHDIKNKQDIVEEIVRLVGIDNIESKPFELIEENRLEEDYIWYKKRTIYRHKAAQSGFFESIHFVFDEKKVLKSYRFDCVIEEKALLNPIVNTLDTLRPTLLTGLLKAASSNAKNGYSSIKLFEVGSVFDKERKESVKMSMLFSGAIEQDSIRNFGKPSKINFALFVQKISDIIGEFELSQSETTHSLSNKYQSAKIIVDGDIIGEMFRVHPSVENSYDLDVTYMCELDFEKLSFGLKVAHKISKYQASFKDLSLIMPKSMRYEEVKTVIDSIDVDNLVRFYPVDKYSDESLGDNMSLSIRFVLQSEIKTLQEDDINIAMDTILSAVNSKLGIGLRK
ncbi:MAG: phenylalanine--tRNA ligase subunit beta [Sulfurimonas sp.]|nr:phenylalanine--tRNA ligase subunit beta [Sulfurimonas sp.]